MRSALCTCQPGYEALLAREWTAAGGAESARGPGWMMAAAPVPDAELVFAHLILEDPASLEGDSVNRLAQSGLTWFGDSIRGERIESEWPILWQGAADAVGLARRAASVENAFATGLQRQFSRVAKLACRRLPTAIGPARGVFVYFTDFNHAWASRAAFVNGQRRMADDPAAPSRSYLKVEEAYLLLGREPAPGETVADLGAAPGGWSYSAARRGARVTAVDNGPLKGGALNHPNIEHVKADAFRFAPASGSKFDWLFCDLVEEPHHVLSHLVGPWLAHGWCRQFIVNLKFGRVDPLAFLAQLRSPDSPLARASAVRIRHLFHDREEFTVAGVLANGTHASS